MAGLNGLTLAVPRRALMGETLDPLDALGAATADDRKLHRAGVVVERAGQAEVEDHALSHAARQLRDDRAHPSAGGSRMAA